jgi:hypothetical protein
MTFFFRFSVGSVYSRMAKTIAFFLAGRKQPHASGAVFGSGWRR